MSNMSNERRIKLERAIVRALINHMDKAGWEVSNVFDSEIHHFPATINDAIESVFAVDEVSLRFVKATDLPAYDIEVSERYQDVLTEDRIKRPCSIEPISGHIGGDWADNVTEHGVRIILGEAEDIINDWNYSKDDADGFNAAMEAFDAEKVRA